MKKNATRKALFSSVLALVLCFSMLMSTTFAWFTDSAASANNIIQPGNLDVTLEYWDGDSYEEVAPTQKLFDEAALWEPGHVEVAYLKVSNAGSLAMKYQLNVNVFKETVGKTMAGADLKLSDHLVFSVIDKEITSADDVYSREAAMLAAGNAKGLKAYNGETKSLAVGGSDYVALVIYMPTNVGNEANHDGEHLPSIEMGVNVIATQFTYEKDSFGPDYDEDAWADGFKVHDANDLQAALNEGETNIVLMDDIEITETIVVPAPATSTYSLRATPSAVTINLNGKTVAAASGAAIRNEGNLVLTGAGKITSVNTYAIRVQQGSLLIDSDSIEVTSAFGAVSMFNDAQVTINGGSYTATGSAGKTHHCVYVGSGADLVINGGTFEHKGAGVSDSGATLTVYAGENGGATINGGTFIGSGTYIAPFDKYDSKCYLTIQGGTFSKDPSRYLAEGHVANQNADGSWTALKGDVVAGDNAALNDAIANGTSDIALGNGNFTMPSTSGDITISGTKDTVITIGKPTANKVALNGVTVVGSGNYTGIQHSDTVIYENCTIKGVQFLYANKVVFKNCTIDLTEKADYIWTYGAKNVEFIDCTFNTAGKALLIYTEDANMVTNVTVKGCTFNATQSALASGAVAAAIEIDSSLSTNGHYTLTTENNVVDSDFSGEWRVKKSGTNNTTVNGVIYNKVADGLYMDDKNTYFIYNANGMDAFAKMVNVDKKNFNGKTVLLTADIDLANAAWTPIGQTGNCPFQGIFDGQGHTISNLNVDTTGAASTSHSSGLFGWLLNAAVKNLNVENANVVGEQYIGVIAGYLEWEGCTIENCHVTGATVTGKHVNNDHCGDKVGVIAGFVGNAGTSVKGCSATDCTVTAGRDAGQIAGAAKTANVVDCEATNVTVTASGDCTSANVNNAVIGRIL